MIAGTLEIQMLANIARLQKDMTQAKGMVSGAMKSIEGAVASAKSALGALGIGLGVGYFVSLIKGSIDAIDHLNDLSKSTSLTVEQLAGLRLAAKQSGGDLDSISAAINKLSQNIGKDGEKFRALGITAKEPLEAFKQLSDIFVSIQDPQQRAALAAAALGKSWAGAAPLLAEGSKRIGEIVDRGTRLSGVTKEMAEQADAFNDKWAELTGTGGIFLRLIGPMLPLLNSMADEMLKVGDSAGKIDGSFKPMLETLRALVVMGGEFAFVWQQIGISFAGVGAQFSAFKGGGMKALLDTRAMISDILNEERKLHDAWVARMMAAGTPGAAAPGGSSKPSTVSTGGVGAFLGTNAADLAAQKKLLADGEKGWVAYADAVFKIADEENLALAKINEDYWKEKDKLRAADQAAMFAMFDAEQDAAIAAGAIMSQEITEQSKLWTKAADEVSEAWKTAAKDMQRGMSGFFFDVMQGNLSDLSGSFKRTVDKMVADALAAKAAVALFGNDFMNGNSNSPMGGWIGAAMGAFGFGGGGGNASLAADVATGIGFPEYATGTNYVPRTGLALVHQGEEIIPANQNGSRGGVTIIQNFAPGTDRATVNQAAARTGEAVQRAMARNT